MFRKLRIKLTLINVVVVGYISLFFMLGIFALTLNYEYREMLQTMQSIATDAGAKPKIGTKDEYRFLKAPQSNGQGYILVFANKPGVDGCLGAFLAGCRSKRGQLKNKVDKFKGPNQ